MNNRRIEDEDAVLGEGDLLHGRFAVLRRGKRTLGGGQAPPDAASPGTTGIAGRDTPQCFGQVANR